MAFNLIDEAKSLLPSDLISRAATSLGETESGIQRAFNGSIPTVLSGLLNQTSTGASGILDMVKNASGSNILGNVTGLLSGSSISGIGATIMGWLRSLFGDRLSSVTNSLASFAGIKPSSASSVMSMATPAVLGSVGNYVKENNLSASGLGSFLMTQKNSILNAIPSGFNLAGALGLSSLSDIGSRISSTVSSAGNYAVNTVRKTSGTRWLWFLLLLLGAGLLIWLFTRKPTPKEEAATVVADTTSATTSPAIAVPPVTVKGKLDTVTGNFIYDIGEMISIDLPNNGGQLNVGRYSTEARLVEFLKDPNASVDTVNGNWFDFTNVRFKTGSSIITDDSYTQLKNLVAIIKAFPNATFKVGGYTDNTGDPSANMALSQKRADAVAAAIVKQGANKAQLTKAEGYGPEHPVGDNSTADGRAMNRRVSVRVKSK